MRAKEVMQGINPHSSASPIIDDNKITTEAKATDRILVLEDNLVIHEVIREMCKVVGFEPQMTTDGSEAFSLYKQRAKEGKPFDVVLLDLNIPRGMGGLETARNILETDPEAQLVVCSGNSHDPVMRSYLDHGFIMRLSKPFHFSQFKSLIKHIRKGK
jgi:CheY-like chemotaxis protein